MSETVLIIPDTQYPFSHSDHLKFLNTVADRYSPTKVVHIGDLLDFHALSDYNPDPDGDAPGKEFEKGMKHVRRLYSYFPSASLCTSNHDARPYRRAYKYGLPEAFLRKYSEWLEFPPGWSIDTKFIIDNVVYEHGEGMSGMYAHKHAAERNMQSTVMGHLHSNAGVEYVANQRHLIFGLAVGCLIDTKAYAFAYGKNEKRKPILGCGLVAQGIPMFIPMLLNSRGRWTGELGTR